MTIQLSRWTCISFLVLLLATSAVNHKASCPACSNEAFVNRVISDAPPIGDCIAISKKKIPLKSVLNRRKRSTVGKHSKRIWNEYKDGHNYIIPYAIATNYDTSQLARIQGAISDIEKNTCIKFKLINTKALADEYQNKSHVEIKSVPGGGCHSVIGRKPGKNMVKLEIRVTATKTCIAHHVIIHELLHLLGLYHEHQRPDRDEFITIHKERVLKGRIANFNIAKGADTFRLPYDYCSIMHYRDVTFSANSLPVMVTKESKFQANLGKAKNPSELINLKKIQKLDLLKQNRKNTTITTTNIMLQ
uniref:Metalloendopeptidase n=1 Tax=Ditylenchus dipsaci TaxID=166011 RepID=A0A915DGN6_9BILA